MANLFTFLVGVLMFAGLIVAIARTGREEKRAQAEADAAYCAEQHLNAQRCIRDVDAMLQRIPNSPLLTAEARREWEVLKRRFAAEPPARDVIEQIRVAPQNAAYVLGLEQGDQHLRAQAVMELFAEAAAYGADEVTAQILHLQRRLGSDSMNTPTSSASLGLWRGNGWTMTSRLRRSTNRSAGPKSSHSRRRCWGTATSSPERAREDSSPDTASGANANLRSISMATAARSPTATLVCFSPASSPRSGRPAG